MNELVFYACNCAALGYPNHLPLCPNCKDDCSCPSSGHLPTCPLRNLPPEPKPWVSPTGGRYCPGCGTNIQPEREFCDRCAKFKADAEWKAASEDVHETPPALPKTVFKFLVQVEVEEDALGCSLPEPVACVTCKANQRSFLRAIISAQVSNYLIGKDPLHWFPYKPQITVTPES